MSNTHDIADMAAEIQAICADHLPACIISGGSPTVPTPPSLVLAAFATEGYVRDTDDLVYVNQESHSIILTGSDGNYWLAVSVDTWTSYAQWTTEAGSAYRWRPSATQPADVAGLLTFASVTVSGGAITATAPLATVTRAAAGRALLALGTMATQNASAVAITGGSAQLGGKATPYWLAAPNAQLDTLYGAVELQNTLRVNETLGVGSAPKTNVGVTVRWNKASQNGLECQPSDSDSGGPALQFLALGGGGVGSITTTATATAYNTSSDARLKHAIAPLTAALERVRALRPVAFTWNADSSPGVGFLAHELMTVVPEAVTGEPDAVNADGSVQPQQVDHSRVIPWLTAALQEVLGQVEALTARVAALETSP